MHPNQRHGITLPAGALLLALAAAMAFAPAPRAADGGTMEGSVEFLYRNVSQDGSREKYDEDFDGLSSGLRLGNVTLDWADPNMNIADYARISLNGLGGDPYQSSSLRMGRADSYDLSFRFTKQDYIYNLFPVTDDLDAHEWDTERSRTDLNLRIHASDAVDVVVGYREVSRRGDHLFMKDIQRDLFQLETPLDQVNKRYSAGVDVKAGPVDIVFRQELVNNDLRFDNFSDGDPGLDDPNTSLNFYEWTQRETVSSDYTTVKVHSPFGDRVDATVSVFGSLLGKEEIKSRVRQDADGLDFNAQPFTIVNGFSNTDVEMDTLIADVDVAVRIVDPLTLILQYRKMQREAEGEQERDLENDPNTALTRDVLLDYEVDTIAGILQYRPHRTVSFRGGYRTTDRELERDGFGGTLGLRDEEFESDGDTMAIFGASWRPKDWLRFNVSFEDGERDVAFTAPSLVETERLQFRATVNPQPDMTVAGTYSDFENDNPFFGSTSEGTNWSLSFFHVANERVNYSLSYSAQEVDTATPIVFDVFGFGAFPGPTEAGDTFLDVDHMQGSALINWKITTAWETFLRYTMTESDGNNLFIGDASGAIDDFIIDQKYTDAEAGALYRFPTGLFIGGSLRVFDYEDDNDLVDYEGEILLVRGGLTF